MSNTSCALCGSTGKLDQVHDPYALHYLRLCHMFAKKTKFCTECIRRAKYVSRFNDYGVRFVRDSDEDEEASDSQHSDSDNQSSDENEPLATLAEAAAINNSRAPERTNEEEADVQSQHSDPDNQSSDKNVPLATLAETAAINNSKAPERLNDISKAPVRTNEEENNVQSPSSSSGSSSFSNRTVIEKTIEDFII